MVPPYSHRVPRVRRYSGYGCAELDFAYMTITFSGLLSQTILLSSSVAYAVRTPPELLQMVWPLPRSLATTSGISVDFFSSPYLDVSVQAVPRIHLCIQCMLTYSSYAGFPHSEIHGSMAAFASPWLIVDRYVLRRLLVPRHSPYALFSLTISFLIHLFKNHLVLWV